MIEIATSATDTTQAIVRIIARDRERIHDIGRGAATAHRVHDLATRRIIVRPTIAAETLGLTDPPVYAAIRRLEALGILKEVTGRRRGKRYAYGEYLGLLNQGTT